MSRCFAKRIYGNSPILLPNRVTHEEIVELHVVDFYVFLCTDWLHALFASIEFGTRVVKFNLPNDPVLELKMRNTIHRVEIIFFKKRMQNDL